MYIENLSLHSFRNYKLETLRFSDKTNIFIGDNGHGKTNLLEAVYYLATGRSFRGANNDDLININENFFALELLLNKQGRKFHIELSYAKEQYKKVRVNGTVYRKNSDLYNFLKVVLFHPDDLSICKGGPDKRRNYINYILSINDLEYREDLKNYEKILREKNNYLKSPFIMRNEVLEKTLDEQLVHYGSRIIISRQKFLRAALPLIYEYYAFLTDSKEKISITYNTFIDKDSFISPKKIEERYKKIKKKFKQEESKRRYTIIGPHRDDLIFYLNEKDIKKFGSQGQQRTLVLALKLAEIELLSTIGKDYPVLLLDDVMSELDEDRRCKLLEIVEKNNLQVLITGTEKQIFCAVGERKDKYFMVKNGCTEEDKL